MVKKPIVLVVEDEPLILLNAVMSIEDAGFAALEAADADKAIDILERRTDISVVFSDVHMPGSMDGLELVHHIKKRWPPVRLITTSGLARLVASELPAGGEFLPKPYTSIDLCSMIARMVGDSDL